MNTLQTLDRGLSALEIIARRRDGISIADLSEELGIHRAVTYRVVATLEAHGLATRGGTGAIRLGAGVMALAGRFRPQLRAIARPFLAKLAARTGATAFLSVAEGEDCVVILVEEPEAGVLRVGYRTGSRHPLSRGAAGIAILSGRPPRQDDPPAILQARADGYSVTRGQIQRGAMGVASPLRDMTGTAPRLEAAIGVVTIGDLDVAPAAEAVKAGATELSDLLLDGSRAVS